jgi:predicted GNAT family acetyltransferase
MSDSAGASDASVAVTPDMDLVVHENVTDRYFELLADGVFAGGIVYEVIGSTMSLTHTQIEPAYRHQGLASVLIRGTLEAVLNRGLTLESRCPIVDDYVTAHPEYEGLVAKRAHRTA